MRGKPKFSKRANYRSGLEKIVGECMDAALIKWKHESEKLPYTVPIQKRTYNPDFQIAEAPHIILEAKGIFSAEDRKKMLLVKEQYPDRQIVMLFGRAKNFLRKGSKTTYAAWCDKNDIKWIDLNEFAKDPRTCLLSTTSKQSNGKSLTSPRKKRLRSLKSVRKGS